MSKLITDQKSIKNLFSEEKTNFIFPDYQRPYSWTENECQRLWSDLLDFAFPGGKPDAYDQNAEYFLGPIVTNKSGPNLEVIDGQQRITTIALLLRVFYTEYEHMEIKDKLSRKVMDDLESCIWHLDCDALPIKSQPKVTSSAVTDDKKAELQFILETGAVPEKAKSNYATNYTFLCESVQWLKSNAPSYFSRFVNILLNNCILLPIEADEQETALRIFSTLNDRGMPLSDSDIFKSELYKFYDQRGEKESFVSRWNELEKLCNKLFQPLQNTPMDEIFSRYMHYERAKQGITATTTESLRGFYEKDKYALLKNAETFENIIDLASFWKDVLAQNQNRFSERVLKQLFILNYAPNSMYTYYVSVYYMANRSEDGSLDDEAFYDFLEKAAQFILAYNFIRPGVNSLRTPIYKEMVNLIDGVIPAYEDFRFNEQELETVMTQFKFSNNRGITKSMLVWWAYQFDDMPLLPLDTKLEIEHIYARSRYDNERSLSSSDVLESIGNKAILERHVNIRASDYRFKDKIKYYLGFQTESGKTRVGTKNAELLDLASRLGDFTEDHILHRKKDIIDSFLTCLGNSDLLKNENA